MKDRLENDAQIANELNAIKKMVSLSEQEGLLVEVIWTLVNSMPARIDGDTIEKACSAAMYEWDI